MWRVTEEITMAKYNEILISIHALRVEGDRLVVDIAPFMTMISIHTLRVEGDITNHTGSSG